jgi:hypothetical protein
MSGPVACQLPPLSSRTSRLEGSLQQSYNISITFQLTRRTTVCARVVPWLLNDLFQETRNSLVPRHFQSFKHVRHERMRYARLNWKKKKNKLPLKSILPFGPFSETLAWFSPPNLSFVWETPCPWFKKRICHNLLLVEPLSPIPFREGVCEGREPDLHSEVNCWFCSDLLFRIIVGCSIR